MGLFTLVACSDEAVQDMNKKSETDSEVNYSTNINTETASTTGVLIGVDISIRAEAVETGRSHVKEITYILTSEEFPEGIKEGYVILGARPVMSQEEIKAREEMWGWHE